MRISLLFVMAFVIPQAQPPDTDVFLARLTGTAGKVTVSAIENISNSPGYDNQPSFTRDGETVFFTSARTGQMDIYRYDTATKSVAAVTQTPESEYSATLTPDGRTAYVANAGSNSVSVVDVVGMREIMRIPVGQVPKRNITAMLP